MKTKNIDAKQIQEEIIATGISELTSNVNLHRIWRGQHRIHRRALQLKRKKEPTKDQTYDVLVLYSNPNYLLIKKAFPAQRWIDSTHTWFENVSMKRVEEIKELLKGCIVHVNGQEFKIRVCVYRHVEKPCVEPPKTKSPNNNTAERKKSAQNAKKAANLARHANAHKQAERRNQKKAAKEAVNHSAGSNLTSNERKYKQNLKRAVKYFTKQQTRTIKIVERKKHFKNSKQLEFNFKVAA